jgi:hypothetical protein
MEMDACIAMTCPTTHDLRRLAIFDTSFAVLTRRPLLAAPLLLLGPACAGPGRFDYRGVSAPAPVADSFRAWRPDQPPAPLSRRAGAPDPSAECVPFARALSGIDIVGDAWTWWDRAAGRHARGHRPEVGSVMVFGVSEELPLGHVAVVTAVLDPRAVLISHRNWAGGLEKGRIDLDRPAEDVSRRNDWSRVRVWHAATGRLGPGAHALAGFVHPHPPERQRDDRAPYRVAQAR